MVSPHIFSVTLKISLPSALMDLPMVQLKEVLPPPGLRVTEPVPVWMFIFLSVSFTNFTLPSLATIDLLALGFLAIPVSVAAKVILAIRAIAIINLFAFFIIV